MKIFWILNTVTWTIGRILTSDCLNFPANIWIRSDMYGSTSSPLIFQSKKNQMNLFHTNFSYFCFFFFFHWTRNAIKLETREQKQDFFAFKKCFHSGPDWCDLWYHFHSWFLRLLIFLIFSSMTQFCVILKLPGNEIYIYFILSPYKQTARQDPDFAKEMIYSSQQSKPNIRIWFWFHFRFFYHFNNFFISFLLTNGVRLLHTKQIWKKKK